MLKQMAYLETGVDTKTEEPRTETERLGVEDREEEGY